MGHAVLHSLGEVSLVVKEWRIRKLENMWLTFLFGVDPARWEATLAEG